jgi:SusD family.
LNQTVGMWYYNYDGTPVVRNDYSVHANKWSKFWTSPGNSLGASSNGNTGINYPYMRYADVLLMYAEAVNELEDGVSGANGTKAIAALKEVRNRAFKAEDRAAKVDNYIATASASKESFFKAICDERKFEFGGENMRWKDLVRWNLYSEVVYKCFMRYYAMGCASGGDNSVEGTEEFDNFPFQMFYKIVANPNNPDIYPNTTLKIIDFYNPYAFSYSPGSDYSVADFYKWYNEGLSCPNNQCRFSFRGFIQADEYGVFTPQMDRNNLPPVRYILPIPNSAIQKSNGVYKNYYGYN